MPQELVVTVTVKLKKTVDQIREETLAILKEDPEISEIDLIRKLDCFEFITEGKKH